MLGFFGGIYQKLSYFVAVFQFFEEMYCYLLTDQIYLFSVTIFQEIPEVKNLNQISLVAWKTSSQLFEVVSEVDLISSQKY